MKKVLIKIPAMIAMLISLLSFFTYVYSFFEETGEYWIVSVLVALLSLGFYFVDAIISAVKACKKLDTKFNAILAVVLFGAIPMALYFGGSGRFLFSEIWNGYYLLIFVLEIISIKRCVKG